MGRRLGGCGRRPVSTMHMAKKKGIRLRVNARSCSQGCGRAMCENKPGYHGDWAASACPCPSLGMAPGSKVLPSVASGASHVTHVTRRARLRRWARASAAQPSRLRSPHLTHTTRLDPRWHRSTQASHSELRVATRYVHMGWAGEHLHSPPRTRSRNPAATGNRPRHEPVANKTADRRLGRLPTST